LSLELTDPGFDFSLLSDFRERILMGGLEQQFLDTLLTHFKQRGLLKERGRQRTDSTHVLATIRTLNRLECVGETLRAALNQLAVMAPDRLGVPERQLSTWTAQCRVESRRRHHWSRRYSGAVQEGGLSGLCGAQQVYPSKDRAARTDVSTA
jgi:hypothetical protein